MVEYKTPEDLRTELESQMSELEMRRTRMTGLQDVHKKAYAVFIETNKDIIAQIEDTQQIISSTEAKARELGSEIYKLTGMKKLPCGLGVREVPVLEYEQERALAWCKGSGLFLSFVKKDFEHFARDEKNGAALDFVTRSKRVMVTLPGPKEAVQ